eukprot:g25250.t1
MCKRVRETVQTVITYRVCGFTQLAAAWNAQCSLIAADYNRNVVHRLGFASREEVEHSVFLFWLFNHASRTNTPLHVAKSTIQ